MRRQYVSMAHYQTPLTSQSIQGLGAVRREYFELSEYRSPYRGGYFQDNTLKGPPDASSVSDLQRALGVPTTGQYDGATIKAIEKAQDKRNLPVTGSPDAALLSSLGIVNLAALPPAGATWRRDLGTATDQVNPYVYGGLSLMLLGIGYYSYKRFKKEHPKP
jgi:hypothetical protein